MTQNERDARDLHEVATALRARIESDLGNRSGGSEALEVGRQLERLAGALVRLYELAPLEPESSIEHELALEPESSTEHELALEHESSEPNEETDR